MTTPSAEFVGVLSSGTIMGSLAINQFFGWLRDNRTERAAVRREQDAVRREQERIKRSDRTDAKLDGLEAKAQVLAVEVKQVATADSLQQSLAEIRVLLHQTTDSTEKARKMLHRISSQVTASNKAFETADPAAL